MAMITFWTTPLPTCSLRRTRLISTSSAHLLRKGMTTVLAMPSNRQARDHKSPRQIIDSLDGAIDKAHKSGDLLLFDSTMSSVEEDGVQVRYGQAACSRGPANLHNAALFLPLSRL